MKLGMFRCHVSLPGGILPFFDYWCFPLLKIISPGRHPGLTGILPGAFGGHLGSTARWSDGSRGEMFLSCNLDDEVVFCCTVLVCSLEYVCIYIFYKYIKRIYTVYIYHIFNIVRLINSIIYFLCLYAYSRAKWNFDEGERQCHFPKFFTSFHKLFKKIHDLAWIVTLIIP